MAASVVQREKDGSIGVWLMEEGNVVELLEENVSNGGKEATKENKMKLIALIKKMYEHATQIFVGLNEQKSL